jgi:hypothetical protein
MSKDSKTKNELNLLTGLLEIFTQEDSLRKKLYLFSVVGVFTSVTICIYIYFDAKECIEYYEKGLLLSFIAGGALIGSIYFYIEQLGARALNTHFKAYVDLDAVRRRYSELGGNLEKKPFDYKVALYRYLRNTFIWALIFTALFLLLKILKH